jgi:hypothetical protein
VFPPLCYMLDLMQHQDADALACCFLTANSVRRARAAQADRDGKHMDFAARYEGSELRVRNALLLSELMEADAAAPSPEVQAELAIKRETANPMVWGVWTLLRVRTRLPQGWPDPWGTRGQERLLAHGLGRVDAAARARLLCEGGGPISAPFHRLIMH